MLRTLDWKFGTVQKPPGCFTVPFVHSLFLCVMIKMATKTFIRSVLDVLIKGLDCLDLPIVFAAEENQII